MLFPKFPSVVSELPDTFKDLNPASGERSPSVVKEFPAAAKNSNFDSADRSPSVVSEFPDTSSSLNPGRVDRSPSVVREFPDRSNDETRPRPRKSSGFNAVKPAPDTSSEPISPSRCLRRT